MSAMNIPGPGDYERFPVTCASDPRALDDEADEISAIALSIWCRDVGVPGHDALIRPEKLREGITEVMGAADEEEIALLAAAAHGDEPDQFRTLLLAMVREYWIADCTERAREQLARLDREAEDEAAAVRMED